MRRALVFAACLALWAPAAAMANGRAPLTNGIFLRPGDDHSLYVRTTFGLLVSHDDGCTFRWICEKAIGYGGEFDPKYAIATDGAIFATTFTGLRVSRDNGCTWTTATSEKPPGDPGRIADIWIDALDISPTGDVWVATAESAKPNDVFRSTDNGVTFTSQGLSSPVVWWKSIKVAKSDPQRVYVTGYQVAGTAQAHLERSTNGGGIWTELPLPTNVLFGSTPIVHVTAVDPADPDHLYLTSLGANPPAGDRVYRSHDGGTTFTEVAATTDPVRDIIVRSNGTALIATINGGTFESAAADGAFARLGMVKPNAQDARPPLLGCLAQKPDGTLVGCGANWQPDYMAVGRASNPLAWQKLFRFVELAGPAECAAGTTSQDMCAPLWPSLQQQFGATGPGTCGALADLEVVDLPTPAVKNGSGCCETGTGSPGGALALSALAGAVMLRRRRAR
ncbi:MAG: exo-alpha-sialidase [Myxococcales bacterium]|nr:exo-alpha-sialidase [Myxococcales bacterium]